MCQGRPDDILHLSQFRCGNNHHRPTTAGTNEPQGNTRRDKALADSASGAHRHTVGCDHGAHDFLLLKGELDAQHFMRKADGIVEVGRKTYISAGIYQHDLAYLGLWRTTRHSAWPSSSAVMAHPAVGPCRYLIQAYWRIRAQPRDA